MAEKRKKSKNYYVLSVINLLMIVCIIVFVGCCIAIVNLIGVNYSLNRIVFYLPILFADIAVFLALFFWSVWIRYEQCDICAHAQYIKSCLLKKRYKGNITLHIQWLYDCLVLGKYDECGQEIEELHRLENRLKPLQKLEIQLYYIDYLLAVNETEPLHTELENAENLLASIHFKREQTKQAYQRTIRLQRYKIENRWEDVLELLTTDIKTDIESNRTVWEEAVYAYYRGRSCYCLGRYEEAFCELRFTAEYAGNSKYVKLANELLEQIPENSLYERKYAGKSKKVKHKVYTGAIVIFAVSCLLSAMLIGFNCYCSYGGSIEQAYSKKYLCEQDKVAVIYQKEIDNYEMAIVYDGKYVTYCLFELKDSDYKIVNSYRVSYEYLRKGNFPEVEEGEKDFFLGCDIRSVITDFYKKNDIFYGEDAEYVGICFYPLAEHIEIEESIYEIQLLDQVTYINDEPVYLWNLENTAIENINYRTLIKVYRAEE